MKRSRSMVTVTSSSSSLSLAWTKLYTCEWTCVGPLGPLTMNLFTHRHNEALWPFIALLGVSGQEQGQTSPVPRFPATLPPGGSPGTQHSREDLPVKCQASDRVMSPSSSYETWSPRQWSLSLKPSSRLLPELTEPWVPLESPKVA